VSFLGYYFYSDCAYSSKKAFDFTCSSFDTFLEESVACIDVLAVMEMKN
jgi:hypothetical protein